MAKSMQGDLVASSVGSEASPVGRRAFFLSGEFTDAQLESQFLEANWSEIIGRARSVELVVALFAAWTVVDYLILGPTPIFWVLCVGRLLSVVLARIPARSFGKAHQQFWFFASVTFVQAYVFGVFLIAVAAGGVHPSEHALTSLILIFAFYFGVPNRFGPNVVVSVVSTLVFIAMLSQYDVSMRSLGLISMLLLAGNICGMQAVSVTNRYRRVAFLTLKRQQELNGQLVGEIAARKKAQRAVQVTEENFHSIFDAAPLAMTLVDPATHRVIQANKAAGDVLGIGEQEFLQADARDFFVEPEAYFRLGKTDRGARNRNKPLELRLRRAEGNIIWALVSTAVVRFDGKPVFLAAIHDVTARRREAEELRNARDHATDASRAKSEFLANMSHELRTPLNAIIGFSEALERELFGPVGNPRYREYAEDIHDSGVHLLNLINDILDLSKIEAGQFVLHEEVGDLDTMVGSACRIVRHRAQQASIAIDVDLPSPAIALNVDQRAMKQIIINLLSNAVKFSNDRGTVHIAASMRPAGLRIAIVDHGIGMAESDIPKAMAPFTQIDGTLSRTHEGTGLGLPLAKHLAELHGGSLTIMSVPGSGTTVYVDLPASRVVHDTQPRAQIS